MHQFVTNYEWLLKLAPIVIIALIIWPIYHTRRKAKWGKVKTSCDYALNTKREGNRFSQTAPAFIVAEASNFGPGEVTISALKGKYRDGSISNIAIREINMSLGIGHQLERIIMPIEENGGKFDGFYNENGSVLVNVWFEDTYGRVHKLNNAKKYLQEIYKSGQMN